jgi:serine/threonine protein phosphatase PrpC
MQALRSLDCLLGMQAFVDPNQMATQSSSTILLEKLRYAGKTDIGRKRQSNQDQFFVAELCNAMKLANTSLAIESHSLLYGPTQSHLFLVADGMGGHQAGQHASDLAIKYFVGGILSSQRWCMSPTKDNENGFLDFLKELLSATHQAILGESDSQESLRGMGTTLTMAYVVWPNMWIVHAGDTRCYLLREGALEQLTRDHTLANQMASQGMLPPELTERSPWSNVLWNALGAGSSEIVADIHHVDLQEGDRILLCSDGLNKHIENREIQSVLSRMETPISTCEFLIDRANELGGSDNITAVVADLGSNSPQDVSTYRANRSSSGDELTNQFTDYLRSPSPTTSMHPDSSGLSITSDYEPKKRS